MCCVPLVFVLVLVRSFLGCWLGFVLCCGLRSFLVLVLSVVEMSGDLCLRYRCIVRCFAGLKVRGCFRVFFVGFRACC